MSKKALLLLLLAFVLNCNKPVSEPATPTIAPTPTPARAQAKPADSVLRRWEQTVGRTSYRWDGKDLYAKQSSDREIPIFNRAAIQHRRSFERSGCELSNYFSPAAVVGGLVSYEHETNWGGVNCGVSSGEWRLATVDVSDSTRFLDLRSLFGDLDLLNALLENQQLSSDIQKSIYGKKLDAVPNTLDDLSKFLTKFDYQLFDGDSYFETDYLSRFAFHHLEGQNVCIRISATSTSTAGRAIHDYVEILLPIPERLRDKLQKADSGTEGFLMKDAETKVGTAYATIELTI